MLCRAQSDDGFGQPFTPLKLAKFHGLTATVDLLQSLGARLDGQLPASRDADGADRNKHCAAATLPPAMMDLAFGGWATPAVWSAGIESRALATMIGLEPAALGLHVLAIAKQRMCSAQLDSAQLITAAVRAMRHQDALAMRSEMPVRHAAAANAPKARARRSAGARCSVKVAPGAHSV